VEAMNAPSGTRGHPPFDDEAKLIDALTHIWMTVL
jgi:hypothetical protein